MVNITRRVWLGAVGAGLLAVDARIGFAAALFRSAPKMTVYKTRTCGCCGAWVEHVRAAGLPVEVVDLPDLAATKTRLGVPAALSSCHTGLVDGYVVEGHVPADLIQRLLDERPRAVGLAVPGMPIGSPGMEGPFTETYQVLLFDRAGTSVYATRP